MAAAASASGMPARSAVHRAVSRRVYGASAGGKAPPRSAREIDSMSGVRPGRSVRPNTHAMPRNASAGPARATCSTTAKSIHGAASAAAATRDASQPGRRAAAIPAAARASKATSSTRLACTTARWSSTGLAHAMSMIAVRTVASLLAVSADVRGEAAQAGEDPPVRLVVGAQLHAVRLPDRERDLEHVNRVEAEALAVERRLRVDRVRGDLQVHRLDDEACDLGFKLSLRGHRDVISWRHDSTR